MKNQKEIKKYSIDNCEENMTSEELEEQLIWSTEFTDQHKRILPIINN